MSASVLALTTTLFVATGPAGAQTVSELQNGIATASDDAFSEAEDEFDDDLFDDFAGDTDDD